MDHAYSRVYIFEVTIGALILDAKWNEDLLDNVKCVFIYS